MAEAVVKAFEVGVRGTEWTRTVYALTPGKAKADYLRDVSDCWPDIKFTDITCRTIGVSGLYTDPEFLRTAEYRGVPFAKIGMKVRFLDDNSEGVIVGKNSSANFDILFTSGKFKGETGNCHPNWMIRYFETDGTIIKEFRG